MISSDTLSNALLLVAVILLASGVYVLHQIREQIRRQRLDLIAELLGREAPDRAALARQNELLSNLTDTFRNHATRSAESYSQALQLLRRQHEQGEATAVFLRESFGKAEAPPSLDELKAKLEFVADQNLRLITSEDDAALTRYVASELLLSAKLDEVQSALRNGTEEDFGKVVRKGTDFFGLGRLTELIGKAIHHPIVGGLLGKVNDLVAKPFISGKLDGLTSGKPKTP